MAPQIPYKYFRPPELTPTQVRFTSMNPSPAYESQATNARSDAESKHQHHDDPTLVSLEGVRVDMQQNSDIMRQVLEELRRINTDRNGPDSSQSSNASEPNNASGNRVKDIGAAYAVVAVFIASIDVGLLTYAHDNFIDRPDDTPAKASDSAINTLWFLSIIFAGIAAMQFAVMQVFSSAAPGMLADTADNSNDIEKGRVNTSSTSGTTDTRTGHPVQRARQRFLELHSAGVTAIVLLMLSLATLFSGILAFVWADQTKVVAIIVTIFFGLAWLVPKIPSTFFLSTASMLGL